ncbi:MAG TPA: hypothetical protein VM261_07110 [Kofleriaceae bacterium]|nr:hypothetical protein [Kofleriaceae bacterium]
MKKVLLASLLVSAPALVACTDPTVTQHDRPLAVAASGDHIVATAAMELESTGFGCGGGDVDYGASALFVSDDRGATFERVVPPDTRALTFISARGGMFYAIAHRNDGAFGVVRSADGRAWTEVATSDRFAEDLAVSSDALLVAHTGGVLASSDGAAWNERSLAAGDGYQARVARSRGAIVVGTAAAGTLQVSTEVGGWRQLTVPGFTSISQLIGAGDAVLVSGYTDNGQAFARVDVNELELPPAVRTGSWSGATLTPAGLLDRSGTLATVDASGIGAPAPHIDPFTAASVDGDHVVVLRDGTLSASTDGGRTFTVAGTLPLLTLKIPSEVE